MIVEKLSCLKDACAVLPHKFSTSASSEKIPYADFLSSVRNFHDDIIAYDAGALLNHHNLWISPNLFSICIKKNADLKSFSFL